MSLQNEKTSNLLYKIFYIAVNHIRVNEAYISKLVLAGHCQKKSKALLIIDSTLHCS